MEFRKFNEIAELVGITAIVASLVFVGMQLRQSHRIALAEVETTIQTSSFEMTKFISDNADIWQKGNSDAELTDAEATRFVAMVIALSNQFYSQHKQFSLLGENENADYVIHNFAAFLHQNPGARRAWLQREAELKEYRRKLNPGSIQTSSRFVEMIEADFAMLDQARE